MVCAYRTSFFLRRLGRGNGQPSPGFVILHDIGGGAPFAPVKNAR
jgi:hypothetical protein